MTLYIQIVIRATKEKVMCVYMWLCMSVNMQVCVRLSVCSNVCAFVFTRMSIGVLCMCVLVHSVVYVCV